MSPQAIALGLLCIVLLFIRGAYDYGLGATTIGVLVAIPFMALIFALGLVLH